MLECTIKDEATSFNPRKVAISDAKKLIKSAFYGEIINF